jgi:hypothetical protein
MGAAVVLALGIAAAGALVGRGFVQGRSADRYVTVKGVSEREVVADVAFWPLTYVATNERLPQAQAELDTSRRAILEFLQKHGIEVSQVVVRGIEVTDRRAERYGGTNATDPRYTISQSLMVRSDDPERIRRASQAVGDLVQAGVPLSAGGGWGGGPTYLFTRLDEHKPDMIAEATAQAREAAQKFAEDSGAALGGIRRANQGVFEILPRDRAPGIPEASQPEKTLRIVSTVEYSLAD